MLELKVLLRRKQAFNTRVDKAVHRRPFWSKVERTLTPPDRIRLKNEDILVKGTMALPWGVKTVGLRKGAGQGVRRGAEYGWPHIRLGGEGGCRMVEVGLMREEVGERGCKSTKPIGNR